MRSLGACLAVVALLCAGCFHEPVSFDGPGCQSGSCTTLHLIVSNQSIDIDPVAIDISIDDFPAVTGDFDAGDQHNWRFFEFRVDRGEHLVRAAAPEEDVVREESIDVSDERWVVIDFWYYSDSTDGAEPMERQFSFLELDEAPHFE